MKKCIPQAQPTMKNQWQLFLDKAKEGTIEISQIFGNAINEGDYNLKWF